MLIGGGVVVVVAVAVAVGIPTAVFGPNSRIVENSKAWRL